MYCEISCLRSDDGRATVLFALFAYRKIFREVSQVNVRKSFRRIRFLCGRFGSYISH